MQQIQSKIGTMKPKKVDTSIRNALGKPTGLKTIGAGWGGEKPVKPVKTVMKSTMKKAVNTVKKLPSKTSVMKSINKSKGY